VRDFDLSMYRRLCEAAISSGAPFYTVADYLDPQHQEGAAIVLRHDVDRLPSSALTMAKLEAELGLRATYYFRAKRVSFSPRVMTAVSKLGHEVGYHYETLCDARGDIEAAAELFRKELARFRQHVDISTASMHGRPLSRWDSRDLWKYYRPSDFDLIGEAYISIDYSRIRYFNDTGRTWADDRYNLRDRVDAASSEDDIASTDELVRALERQRLRRVCISAHPNRWPASRTGWLISNASDFAMNRAKLALKALRG